MDVETLRLKPGEAVGDLQELLANGRQVVEVLFEAEVRQIVAADFIPQIGGELLVLLEEGPLPIGAEHMGS